MNHEVELTFTTSNGLVTIAPVIPPTPPATKCLHPATLRGTPASGSVPLGGPLYAAVAVTTPSGDVAVAVETVAIGCILS